MKAARNPTNFGQLPEFSSEYVDFPVRIKSRAQPQARQLEICPETI
jgi:hypothetical protein